MAQVNTGIVVPLFRKIAEGFQKIFIPSDHIMLSDNKTTLEQKIDEYKLTPMMTVLFSASGEQDVAGQVELTLSTLRSDTSNGYLTQSSGGVRIGAGVKQVLVSANIFAYSNSNPNGYFWNKIVRKRGSASYEVATGLAGVTEGRYVSCTITPIPIDVQEGDVIKLCKLNTETTKIRGGGNTYLTVQIIEFE